MHDNNIKLSGQLKDKKILTNTMDTVVSNCEILKKAQYRILL